MNWPPLIDSKATLLKSVWPKPVNDVFLGRYVPFSAYLLVGSIS